jgi:phage repressor protein C with HTH and peptisase S24 domain/DNA-binding transcriptional regulator YiaG
MIAESDQSVNRNSRPYFSRELRYGVRMSRTTPAAIELRKAREASGISMREVARRLGMSPNSYRHYEQPDLFKGVYLPLEFAQKLAAVVEDGDFMRKVWELSGALDGFEPVNDDAPNLVRIENEDAATDARDLVPVYGVEASAGHGAVVSEEIQEYSLAFPSAYLRTLTTSSPENLSIISVKGESMEPTLLDNDIVLLDTSKINLSHDGLFVIRFDDVLHVKRVGRSPKRGHITIISDNKELYPPMEAAASDIEPVGKVLWYGRKV